MYIVQPGMVTVHFVIGALEIKAPVPSNAGQAVAGGTKSALKTTTAFIPMGRYFP